MPSVTVNANQMAVVSRTEPDKNWNGLETFEIKTGSPQSYSEAPDKIAYVSFEKIEIPQGAVVSTCVVRLYAQLTVDKITDQFIYLRVFPLDRTFDQNSVTYNTRPEGTKANRNVGFWQEDMPSGYVWCEAQFDADKATGEYINAIQNGCKIDIDIEYGRYTSVIGYIKSHLSQQAPQVVVTYSPPTVRISPGFTAGVYIPKNLAKSISWSIGYDSNKNMIGTPKQVSAEVRCKSGETTKTIQITGSDTTAIIPAGTFTEGEGQIQIAITTTAGGMAESDWITVNNTDETGTAIAVSPRGVRGDGDTNLVFSWDYDNPTGTPQTIAESQVRYDGGGK